MSANLDSIEQSFSDQLARFDGKIRTQEDNASLLNEIHASLTVLLAQTGDHDDDLREILQKRYNAGKLRLETYQLVRNVLDRVVIESMTTMPDAVDEDDTDDSYRSTTVIERAPAEQKAPQDHLQIGSVLRDRFLLQERVAGGSMGVVYKAHDRRLAEADGFDPWVAIKVLSPKLSRNAHALRALQQEAAKGRCLSHPNIVRFIDLDRDGDIYFIVMEWLEGRSLAAILDEKKGTRIDLDTSLDIVRQLALALDYAHRCGVVHADVKPANIMVTPSGQVKLFDFGIARIRQQHETRSSFDPGVLGAITPAYSSMQVITGEVPTQADDVFSLGCLMYRMIAGHRVFGPRNAAEAAEQGMEPQRPAGLGDQQWRALKKSLAFARVARFESPAEFLEALEAEEKPPHSGTFAFESDFEGPIVVEPKPRAPEARNYWPVAIVFLAAVAIALALVARPDLLDPLKAMFAPADPADTSPAIVDTAPVETPDSPGPDSAEDRAPADPDLAPGDTTAVPPIDPGAALPSGREPAAAADRTPSRPDPAGEDPFMDDPIEIEEAPAVSTPATPADETSTGQRPRDDFPALPAASAIVPLAGPGSLRTEVGLTLREGEDALGIDLVRQVDLDAPLTVRLEEAGYTGNRSPWEFGRYTLSNNGTATFEPGQARARVTVTMSSNDAHDPDVQASLLVRDAADVESQLALINLTLEDDDQRSFESTLPANTVGFSVSRMSVNERDPAVQIDVLRYNPSDTELEIRYAIAGGSATEGEDYFLPGATALIFEPRQRSARLLIPLVQDSVVESDETFILELRSGPEAPQANIFRRIDVIIRDDDG